MKSNTGEYPQVLYVFKERPKTFIHCGETTFNCYNRKLNVHTRIFWLFNTHYKINSVIIFHQTDKYPVSLVYSWIGQQTGNKRPRVYSQLQNRLVISNKLFTRVKVLCPDHADNTENLPGNMHRKTQDFLLHPKDNCKRIFRFNKSKNLNSILFIATFNILQISKLCGAFTIALY